MHIFDITTCSLSQVLFYAFFQNFEVSFYLFANKLENLKDKTNMSIFILPNMSFKVTVSLRHERVKRFRRSF